MVKNVVFTRNVNSEFIPGSTFGVLNLSSKKTRPARRSNNGAIDSRVPIRPSSYDTGIKKSYRRVPEDLPIKDESYPRRSGL